jgi:hypothetical protein
VNTDTLFSVFVGIGLAAACGFRVFVPLLVLSIASLSGHVTLGQHFQWIGTYPALIAFSVATVVEILGYYIPWIDHLLDTIASPAAVIAGIIVSASMMGNLDPFLRWTLAVIAGGGISGLVQSGTVLTRVASTSTTGGIGNPVVSTGEMILAVFTSVLAVIWPVLVILLVVVFGIFALRKIWKKFHVVPKPVPQS